MPGRGKAHLWRGILESCRCKVLDRNKWPMKFFKASWLHMWCFRPPGLSQQLNDFLYINIAWFLCWFHGRIRSKAHSPSYLPTTKGIIIRFGICVLYWLYLGMPLLIFLLFSITKFQSSFTAGDKSAYIFHFCLHPPIFSNKRAGLIV